MNWTHKDLIDVLELVKRREIEHNAKINKLCTTPSESIGANAIDEAISWLNEVTKANQEKRVVTLPCQIGQKVWIILENKIRLRDDTPRWYISERNVNSIGLSTDGYMNMQLMDTRAFDGQPSPTGYAQDIYWEPGKIGTKIFFSPEEAEKALKAKGGT